MEPQKWTNATPERNGYYWIRYTRPGGHSGPVLVEFFTESMQFVEVGDTEPQPCDRVEFFGNAPLVEPPC